MTITPFRIDVPDAVLTDLRDRLARTRWPDDPPGGGWDYGTDPTYLRELCEYWRTRYDWRAWEAKINAFPQFTTVIDGANVHYLQVKSPEPNALPLIITHGWPGSIVEFLEIIGPLSDPRSHGGDPADAFDVVCPSIPGYGFSGPTVDRGWDVRRVARAFAELMARLDYSTYGAQGGDWGASISRTLGLLDADHVAGVHLNMLTSGASNDPADLDGLTERERERLGDLAHYMNDMSGYAKLQQTRPQTLAYGLADSPSFQLAWIAEKFREWTDCDGDPESAIPRDVLITNTTLYWVTNTGGSSARLYYETSHSGRYGSGDAVTVPVAAAVFPKEIVRPIRRFAERNHNIVQWSEFERGGHFAAMEQGPTLIEDVRAFFRKVR
jgi:microsomal epoxide hydrolase